MKRNLQLAFEEYDKANPQVWDAFIRFTKEAIASGHENLSAKLVIERIRWETMIDSRSDDGFKICNNHSAYYARKFHKEFIEHAGFFRTRTVRVPIQDETVDVLEAA